MNIQFKKNTSSAYGDEELILEDEDGELLDGDSLTFELPFEQIVYERLPNIVDGVLSNVQYGAIIDEELQPANPKAHIFYSRNTGVSTISIGFINDVGTKELLGGINVPSHTENFFLPNYSTTFGKEINEWNGVAIENTLYTNHYKTYIEAIFNIKKRTFSFSAVLPLHIILKLQLNDILKIKGNYYRIDKYTFNLMNGKSQLELVNSFDNTIDPLRSSTNSVYTDAAAKTEIIYVAGLNTDTTINKVDTGYVTTFLTVTQTGNLLELTFTANGTAAERSTYLVLKNGKKTTTIYINQEG